MQDKRLIIVHHSEISLKKGNRGFFERRLKQNIENALADIPGTMVKMDFGRFLLWFPNDTDSDRVLERISKVMGTAALRLAYRGDPEPHKLREQVFNKVRDLEFNTFRIDTRRADKKFPYTSVEVNQIVGARIHQAMEKPVDLKNPDLTVAIEIFNQQVYFSVHAVAGTRGLPVGSTGRVVSLLSSGIDSPVASHMMMSRGATNVFVHFHSFPFTEKTSVYNALSIAKKLTEHQYNSRVYSVPLAPLQRLIVMSAPTKLRVILYRRMMFRLAQRIAHMEHAKALVTGESLGQVASQTLENIRAIEDVVTMPVLRPLIGMDKEAIITKAREIGTFDLSIEPHDDCCSYLVPKSPETKARLAQVKEAESRLVGWEELLEEALKTMEIERIQFPVVTQAVGNAVEL